MWILSNFPSPLTSLSKHDSGVKSNFYQYNAGFNGIVAKYGFRIAIQVPNR